MPLDGEITETTAVNLTAGNPGWDGSPLVSPDGRSIAYRSQARNGYESDLFRVAVLDLASGTTRYLTDRENFDNWVDEIAWSADGRSIVFQGEVHARNPLYRISLDGGSVQPLLTDGTIDGWDLLPDGGVVYVRRTIDHPTELFRAELAGPGADGNGAPTPAQLSHFNRQLEQEVDLRPAEEMWVDGAGDYKVHVFLIKPHDFDPAKKYPLILNVHGGPQSQFMDSFRGDWQVYPGKGYVVAFANPTGSTGYGQDFTEAISGDWGGRVFDDLMKVTDALETLPYVDTSRMGSMGWSYGGYMMMWFEGHTHRFAASASMMGVYDLEAMYGATEELWFPEWDLDGTALDVGPLHQVVAVGVRRAVQDAVPGDHRRAGLPGALHPEPRVLHRPPEARACRRGWWSTRTPATGRAGTRWRSTTTPTWTGSTSTWAAARRRGT